MRRLICLLFALATAMASRGQALPPIQNFGISDYGAGSQNWAISQTEDKHVFFGNNNGLLEYNGAGWKLYPSGNGTIVRSVKVVGERIYTGFYMDFGYWERDSYGGLEYFSLLDKLKVPLIEDEHFWNIEQRDEWILFQSLNRIYLFNTLETRFEVIDFNTNRAKIFQLSDGIYVQNPEKGLYEVRNGNVVLISDHEVFREEIVVGIYEQPGARLVITENGNFYQWKGSGMKEWELSSLDDFEDMSLYSSLRLRDGSLILGTVSNGFIHLDVGGDLIQSVNQEDGLNNNTVLSIFEDAEGNLWLGLDNGISIVNLNSPFRVYKDIRGRLGSVYASFDTGTWLYVGTNQGLFCKRSDEPGEFRLVKGTNGQVWNLKSIEGSLFCGHNKGTFAVEGDNAVLVSDFSGTWDLLPIPGREHLLVQGNYNGLSVLENRKGAWVFRNRIKGFDISSKSFVFTSDSEIVVNHEFKGLFRLEIDPEFREVMGTQAIGRISYDSNISKFGDRNLFSSNEGVHFLDPETSELVYDQFLSDVFYNLEDRISGKLLVEPSEGKLWGFSELNVICLEQDAFDGKPSVRKTPIPKFFRQNQGLTGFENLHPLGEEKYLIGTSTGYVVLDMKDKEQAEHQVEITGVRKMVLNASPENVPLKEDSSFKFEENNISFSLSVPEYEKYTEVDYQYRLSGLNDEWSSWSPVSEVSFGNLPFGDYAFQVRARIGNRPSANEASYSFVIERPWYLSWWVLGVYFALFVLLMVLIHRSYKRYYSRQRAKLIEENQKNLELARLAGEQEIIKLRNEQLQKDIEGKNRELAMTTMSLINKSELLNGIKNDLSNLQDKSSRDQVIRVINRNLNNDHDWEYFQEAFNNADKDFLKKMHELHPNLTPNDLKLCVYLRLNLSSKEIAPLLNISVRSVEIKRYRLRKKMNLEHEKSLVEYILEI